MRDRLFRKVLVVGVICVLMLILVPAFAGAEEPDYNLKMEIHPQQWGLKGLLIGLFFKNIGVYEIGYNVLPIEIFNEGPDTCSNFTVLIEEKLIISFQGLPTYYDYSYYEVEPIEADNDSWILPHFYFHATGLWIIKATIIANDNNQDDNTAECFLLVFHKC